MSDNIPVEIQLEIMNRLPLRSLIQCRSVSKTWKSLIDSSSFIKMHFSSHRTQVQYILVIYENLPDIDYGGYDCVGKYVLVVDDHTFPERKVSPTLPRLVEMLERPRIIGSSHGLLGLYGGIYRDGCRTDVAVLWNISIRKAVVVALPTVDNVREGRYGTTIGFGVCHKTNDPKIVRITNLDHHKMKGMESVACNPPEVEVFTFSTRAWRRSYGNLPRKSIQFDDYNKVNVGGVFYWLAKDVISTVDGGFRHLIISFDMTSEEFKEITLPDSFANMGYTLYLYKRGESLVVVVEEERPVNEDFDVWMMGNGVPKSFTKLCTFTPNEHALVLAEFRNSGEPIYDTLVIDDIVIDRSEGIYYAYQYMETLLLADQPDFMVYE